MIAFVVVACALATVPPAPAESDAVDVLILDLKPISVAPEEARVVDGLIAEAVDDVMKKWDGAPPRVAVADDLRTLLNLQAEKAAAGCDDTTCLAELGGALGARYVLNGSLGKLGDAFVLQLSLFDVANSRSLERSNISAPTVSALRSQIKTVVRQVLVPLGAKPAKAPRASSTSPLLLAGGITAGVGALAAVAGGAVAYVLDERLSAQSSATPTEKRQALDVGRPVLLATALAAGVAVVGLGLAGIGVASGGTE